MRTALGWFLSLVVRLWIGTLRVRVIEDRALVGVRERRWVLGFFHGTQLALHALAKRGPTAVMVSHSKDGVIQAAAMRALGFVVVRGSSSRGGANALAAMVRHVRRGGDAVFAVDGPRGPYGVAKPGAAAVAARGDAVLIPVGCAASAAKVVARAWDRFVLPRPFATVVIVLGAPVTATTELSDRIAACNARARALVHAPRGEQVAA
jgi:lysophospholipid acyltransferase (LPLAT)-like uncharacterized protein